MKKRVFEIGCGDVIKCKGQGHGAREWKVRNIGRAASGMVIINIEDSNPGSGGHAVATIRRDSMERIECIQANGGKTVMDIQKAIEEERRQWAERHEEKTRRMYAKNNNRD